MEQGPQPAANHQATRRRSSLQCRRRRKAVRSRQSRLRRRPNHQHENESSSLLRARQQSPPEGGSRQANPRSLESVPRPPSHLGHRIRPQLQQTRLPEASGTRTLRRCLGSRGCPQRPPVSLRDRTRGVHPRESWRKARGSRSTRRRTRLHRRTRRRPACRVYLLHGQTQRFAIRCKPKKKKTRRVRLRKHPPARPGRSGSIRRVNRSRLFCGGSEQRGGPTTSVSTPQEAATRGKPRSSSGTSTSTNKHSRARSFSGLSALPMTCETRG